MSGGGCLYDEGREPELLSEEQLEDFLAEARQELSGARARFRVVTSIRSENTSRTMGPPYGIMLHHTGGTRLGDFPTLTKPNRQNPSNSVSANDYITKDGTIYELVEHPKRAWHAGPPDRSWLEGPGRTHGITAGNDHFWGIEIENKGREDEPYPRAQVEAIVWRCRERRRKLGITDRRLLIRHRDWAPSRKDDTSDEFPWAEVRRRVFATSDATENGGGSPPQLKKYNVAAIGADPYAIARASVIALRGSRVEARTVRGTATIVAAAEAAAAAPHRKGPRLLVVGQKAAAALTDAGHKLGTEPKSDLFGAVSEASDHDARLREVLAEAISLMRQICSVEGVAADRGERAFRDALVAIDSSFEAKLP